MAGVMAQPRKRKPGPRKDPDSKRSKGGDRHTKPRKAFHAGPELFEALDRYIDNTRPMPTESAVLREALEDYLAIRGHWGNRPPAEVLAELVRRFAADQLEAIVEVVRK